MLPPIYTETDPMNSKRGSRSNQVSFSLPARKPVNGIEQSNISFVYKIYKSYLVICTFYPLLKRTKSYFISNITNDSQA